MANDVISKEEEKAQKKADAAQKKADELQRKADEKIEKELKNRQRQPAPMLPEVLAARKRAKAKEEALKKVKKDKEELPERNLEAYMKAAAGEAPTSPTGALPFGVAQTDEAIRLLGMPDEELAQELGPVKYKERKADEARVERYTQALLDTKEGEKLRKTLRATAKKDYPEPSFMEAVGSMLTFDLFPREGGKGVRERYKESQAALAHADETALRTRKRVTDEAFKSKMAEAARAASPSTAASPTTAERGQAADAVRLFIRHKNSLQRDEQFNTVMRDLFGVPENLFLPAILGLSESVTNATAAARSGKPVDVDKFADAANKLGILTPILTGFDKRYWERLEGVAEDTKGAIPEYVAALVKANKPLRFGEKGEEDDGSLMWGTDGVPLSPALRGLAQHHYRKESMIENTRIIQEAYNTADSDFEKDFKNALNRADMNARGVNAVFNEADYPEFEHHPQSLKRLELQFNSALNEHYAAKKAKREEQSTASALRLAASRGGKAFRLNQKLKEGEDKKTNPYLLEGDEFEKLSSAEKGRRKLTHDEWQTTYNAEEKDSLVTADARAFTVERYNVAKEDREDFYEYDRQNQEDWFRTKRAEQEEIAAKLLEAKQNYDHAMELNQEGRAFDAWAEKDRLTRAANKAEGEADAASKMTAAKAEAMGGLSVYDANIINTWLPTKPDGTGGNSFFSSAFEVGYNKEKANQLAREDTAEEDFKRDTDNIKKIYGTPLEEVYKRTHGGKAMSAEEQALAFSSWTTAKSELSRLSEIDSIQKEYQEVLKNKELVDAAKKAGEEVFGYNQSVRGDTPDWWTNTITLKRIIRRAYGIYDEEIEAEAEGDVPYEVYNVTDQNGVFKLRTWRIKDGRHEEMNPFTDEGKENILKANTHLNYEAMPRPDGKPIRKVFLVDSELATDLYEALDKRQKGGQLSPDQVKLIESHGMTRPPTRPPVPPATAPPVGQLTLKPVPGGVVSPDGKRVSVGDVSYPVGGELEQGGVKYIISIIDGKAYYRRK